MAGISTFATATEDSTDHPVPDAGNAVVEVVAPVLEGGPWPVRAGDLRLPALARSRSNWPGAVDTDAPRLLAWSLGTVGPDALHPASSTPRPRR
jgi:hypothetical protein